MARRRRSRRQTVHIVDLTSAVMDILEDCGEAVEEVVEGSSEKTAQKTVEYLETHGDYEDRTGEYRESFRYKVVNTYRGTTSTVYSEKYQLTHLLEKGHLVAGGTKRTRKFPHWKPASEYAKEYFINSTVKGIQEVEI